MKLRSMLMAMTLLGVASSAHAANILLFSPASTSVNVGGTVVLQVRIDSVTNFAGWQFDLLFNNARFSSTAITDGTIFTTGGNSDFFLLGSVSGGTISGTANSLFGASGVTTSNGLLASFSFAALTAGVGTFSFDLINLIDGNGNQITPGTSGTASVTINAAGGVPEPSTWMLLGGGLFAAGLLRRRLGLGGV